MPANETSLLTREQLRSMSTEELERRLEELRSNSVYKRKPVAERKPVAVVTVPVSDADAKIIARDPESLRLHARREDGGLAAMRPLHRHYQVPPGLAEGPRRPADGAVRVCVELVREVDAAGRPIWPKAGAVHEYNPLDALRRDD